ncbi:PAS domain S-box protein [Candidatus Chloroploca sp. Khr17]|uniref:PAS domain-containing hybrid sensor histidine kinase/response regulator n=1 Tax=Candidatus Chloroploca sp. Khr17 TaxID=2496869 RepID=UPI00101B6930|nr:PAS domain S-box protein [Candidatus Chloroploca sp. Khr17]
MRSIDYLSMLLQTIPDLVWLKDLQGVYVLCNPAFERFVALPKDDVIGKTDAVLFSAEQAAFFRENEMAVIAAGRPSTNEAWVTCVADGRDYLFRTIKTPMYDRAGGLIGVHGIARDITALHETQAALRESELRYRTLFETLVQGVVYQNVQEELRRANAERDRALNFSQSLLAAIPVPVFSKDCEGRYLDCNRAFAEMVGKTPEQLQGKTVQELWPSSLSTVYETHDLAMIEHGGTQTYEAQVIDQHGQRRDVLFVKDVFRDEAGNSAGIIGAFIDITERKQAEAELDRYRQHLQDLVEERTQELQEAYRLLEESARRLALATGSAGIGVWERDRERELLIWDDQMCTLYGIDPRAFDGRTETWLACLHPDDVERALAATERAMRDQQEYVTEFRIVLPDGRIRHIATHAQIERDAAGTPRRVLGVNWDITARKEAEIAQHETVALLRATLESIPDGIMVMGMGGDCIIFNQAFLDLFHFPSDFAVFTRMGFIGHIKQMVRDPEDFRAKIEQRFRSPDEHGVDMIELLDGRIIERHNAPYRVHDETRGIVSYYQDITARRQIERDLERARAAAEAASRAKSSFLANMSHEIRTPMNAIVGLTHLLLRNTSDARQRDQLNRVIDAAQHLLAIINNILDISKIEAGKLGLEAADFALDQVIRNVSDLVIEKAHAKGLEVVYALDARLPPLLHGDPLRLGQILLNFTSNAIKFTDQGTIVLRVRIIKEDEQKLLVRFEVEDTGIGIAPDVQLRLFEVFEQADSSTERKYGGTGLGLAISKRLVQLMNGRLGVNSVVGQGSCFWFEVPLGKSASRLQPRRLGSNLQGLRVLIVDDLEAARDVLGEMLRAMGLVVDLVASGVDALAAVQHADQKGEPYAMVFIDWHMPGLDGVETARRMRLLPLTLAPTCLMITAFGQRVPKEDLERAGFAAFLLKPVTASILFDTLVEVLEGRQLNEVESRPPSPELALMMRRNARILLVEDNPINQEVALDLLREIGFMADLAQNGQIAVDRVRETEITYDLILMDIQMPVLDGLAATRMIRMLPGYEQTPILALTAGAFEEDRQRCLLAGMNGFVAKPVIPEDLYATLATWLPAEAVAMETTESIDALASLREALAAIPGLDPIQGLRNVHGKPKTYARLLRKYAETHREDMDQLRACLSVDDRVAARRIAHSLKSSAATLGINRVHALAAELEALIRAEQGDEAIQGLTFVIEEEQHRIADAIVCAIPAPSALRVDNVNAVHLRTVIDELMALLLQDDLQAHAVYRRHEPLLRSALGGYATILARQMDAFAMEEAVITLRTALGALDPIASEGA